MNVIVTTARGHAETLQWASVQTLNHSPTLFGQGTDGTGPVVLHLAEGDFPLTVTQYAAPDPKHEYIIGFDPAVPENTPTPPSGGESGA